VPPFPCPNRRFHEEVGARGAFSTSSRLFPFLHTPCRGERSGGGRGRLAHFVEGCADRGSDAGTRQTRHGLSPDVDSTVPCSTQRPMVFRSPSALLGLLLVSAACARTPAPAPVALRLTDLYKPDAVEARAVFPRAPRLPPTDAKGARFEIESLRLVFRKEHLATVASGLGWQGLSEVYRETLVARAPETFRFDIRVPARPRLYLAVGTTLRRREPPPAGGGRPSIPRPQGIILVWADTLRQWARRCRRARTWRPRRFPRTSTCPTTATGTTAPSAGWTPRWDGSWSV
jgi:hypothetical protein